MDCLTIIAIVVALYLLFGQKEGLGSDAAQLYRQRVAGTVARRGRPLEGFDPDKFNAVQDLLDGRRQVVPPPGITGTTMRAAIFHKV